MSITYEFYKNLTNDYLENDKTSVIYIKYKEEFYQSARRFLSEGRKKDPSKASDKAICAYLSMVEAPNGSLFKYIKKIMQLLVDHEDLYDYPDRHYWADEDLDNIRDALRPFVCISGILDDKQTELFENTKVKADIHRLLSDANKIIKSKKSLFIFKSAINADSAQHLHEHIIGRIICKAYDDHLYNAGFHIICDEELSHRSLMPLDAHDSRQNTRKNDRTLDIMLRYNKVYGRLPVSGRDVQDEEYRLLCRELYKQLRQIIKNEADPKTGARSLVSIPLYIDPMTGISLQIIGSMYYTNSEEAYKKFHKNYQHVRYCAFSVINRIATTRNYGYSFSDSKNHLMLFSDLNEALVKYNDCVLDAFSEMTDINKDYSKAAEVAGELACFFSYDSDDEDDEEDIREINEQLAAPVPAHPLRPTLKPVFQHEKA